MSNERDNHEEQHDDERELWRADDAATEATPWNPVTSELDNAARELAAARTMFDRAFASTERVERDALVELARGHLAEASCAIEMAFVSADRGQKGAL